MADICDAAEEMRILLAEAGYPNAIVTGEGDADECLSDQPLSDDCGRDR